MELIHALKHSTNKSVTLRSPSTSLPRSTSPAAVLPLTFHLPPPLSCDRVSAIKSYEQWFFDQKPRQSTSPSPFSLPPSPHCLHRLTVSHPCRCPSGLSPELIRVLFAGKNGQEGEGGSAITKAHSHS